MLAWTHGLPASPVTLARSGRLWTAWMYSREIESLGLSAKFGGYRPVQRPLGGVSECRLVAFANRFVGRFGLTRSRHHAD